MPQMFMAPWAFLGVSGLVPLHLPRVMDRRWTLSKVIECVKQGEWEWIWGAKKIKVYVGQGRERAHPTLGDNV